MQLYALVIYSHVFGLNMSHHCLCRWWAWSLPRWPAELTLELIRPLFQWQCVNLLDKHLATQNIDMFNSWQTYWDLGILIIHEGLLVFSHRIQIIQIDQPLKKRMGLEDPIKLEKKTWEKAACPSLGGGVRVVESTSWWWPSSNKGPTSVSKVQSGNPWLQKSMGKTRDESIKNDFLRYQANWLKGIICNDSRKTISFYNIELLWRPSNQFSDYPPEIYLAMWNHNRRSQNIDISGYPQPFCSCQQALNSVVPETSWPQSFLHVRLFSITRNAEIYVYIVVPGSYPPTHITHVISLVEEKCYWTQYQFCSQQHPQCEKAARFSRECARGSANESPGWLPGSKSTVARMSAAIFGINPSSFRGNLETSAKKSTQKSTTLKTWTRFLGRQEMGTRGFDQLPNDTCLTGTSWAEASYRSPMQPDLWIWNWSGPVLSSFLGGGLPSGCCR